jgi:Lipoprotein amino terminal region
MFKRVHEMAWPGSTLTSLSIRSWRSKSMRVARALTTTSLLGVGLMSSACTGAVEPAPSEVVETKTPRGPFPQFDDAGGGGEASYSVELSTVLRAVNQQGTEVQVHGYQLAGTWRLWATEAANDDVRDRWIRARLQLDKVSLGYEPQGILSKVEHERHLRAQLQRPVLLRIDSKGAVAQLKAPADLSAVALGGLKALAAYFQFAPPTGSPVSNAWQTQELDTVGEYVAKYSRSAGGQIVRKKDRYLRLARQGRLQEPGVDAPLAVQSEARFSSDTDGQVVAITGSESLRFAANQLLPELSSLTEVRAVRLDPVGGEPADVNATELGALSELPALAFFADVPVAGQRFELDIAKVSDLRSVAETFRRMDVLASESSPDTVASVRRLELGLAALIRVSPTAEDEAWSLLASTPSKAARLRLALAQSPRAESQQRLLQLLQQDNGLPLEEQSRILVALAENPTPSRLLLDGLRELRKKTVLQDTVLMSIGGVCHEALASNPTLAIEALGDLSAELDAGANSAPNKLAIVLRALGNAGHPRGLALAQPYLTHDSEVVRAAAVRALRRVADPRVDAELARVRELDDSASVRAVVVAIEEQRRQRSLGRVR